MEFNCKIISVGVLVLIISALQGCGYYFQAINGQFEILNKQKPINTIIANKDTPEKLRNRLKLIQKIRDFAINGLKLPGKKHFTKYADLEKPYVIWNLVATPEFSLTPKGWHYPVIGYAEYRGYFSKKDADKYAEKLKKEGYDVYLGGVPAYSTLGWFDDPVLNTFVYYDDTNLAALIIHELAHQVFYVSDDTTFNESFAAAVEHEGVRRWLESRNDSDMFEKYKVAGQRNRIIADLAMRYREKLRELYARDISADEKRKSKRTIFQELRKEYYSLKEQWGGYSGYDALFSDQLNNAQLITMAYYNDLVPDFLMMLKLCGGDLERFYARCRKLSRKSRNDRRAFLKEK